MFPTSTFKNVIDKRGGATSPEPRGGDQSFSKIFKINKYNELKIPRTRGMSSALSTQLTSIREKEVDDQFS